MTAKYPHEQLTDWIDRNTIKIAFVFATAIVFIYFYVYIIAGVNPIPLQSYGSCDMGMRP